MEEKGVWTKELEEGTMGTEARSGDASLACCVQHSQQTPGIFWKMGKLSFLTSTLSLGDSRFYPNTQPASCSEAERQRCMGCP